VTMQKTSETIIGELKAQIRAEILEEMRRDPSTTLLGIPLPRLERYLADLSTYSGDAYRYLQDTDLRAERMAKAWCQYVPGMRYPANPAFCEKATKQACPRCQFDEMVTGPELDKKRLLRCPNCGAEATFDVLLDARRMNYGI
jgi:hypothetical protein